MEHKSGQSKTVSTGRTAARSRNTGNFRRPQKRTAQAQAALSVLMALLHADRWVFEAGEVAKRAGMRSTAGDFHTIRLSIVKSLNKLQPLAYTAANPRKGGSLKGPRAGAPAD